MGVSQILYNQGKLQFLHLRNLRCVHRHERQIPVQQAYRPSSVDEVVNSKQPSRRRTWHKKAAERSERRKDGRFVRPNATSNCRAVSRHSAALNVPHSTLHRHVKNEHLHVHTMTLHPSLSDDQRRQCLTFVLSFLIHHRLARPCTITS